MSEAAVFYGTGRRKRAIARVTLFKGQKGMSINGRDSLAYLQNDQLQIVIERPLKSANLYDQFRVRAQANGGGLTGQADAVSLGIARALVAFDEKLRSEMRRGGYLTRDPREKERKKPGRRGARRSFQYTKR